jgi:two-component system sensor histidine kinase/response regulator
MKEKINILLIEDNPADALLMAIYLNDFLNKYTLLTADLLSKSLDLISKNNFDIILLDLTLPDSRGLGTFEKVYEQASEIPIIVLTGMADETLGINAVKLGAQDFLDKGNIKNSKELIRSINYSIERQKLLKEIIKNKKREQFLNELNATKDKFFSIIGHDLKNPFVVLKSSSELLFKYLEKGDLPKSKAKAKMISNASNQGYTMLENLLLWAKSQTLGIAFEPSKLNLKYKVANNIREVEDHANEKNIIIINEIPDDLILDADENLLSVVVRNLITNAIKFTYNGGTITIKAKIENDSVEIAVIDTGIGIPKEHQHKLFRLDTNFSREGTANEASSSLGLILCKEFIERHKGKIWFESGSNKGSEFRFTLPNIQAKNSYSSNG